jgi:hypothetical protein
MEERIFPYKGRTIYTVKLQDGTISIAYKASETEADRIDNKFKPGYTYQSNDGVPLVLIGEIAKGESKVKFAPPAYESQAIYEGISNQGLAIAINDDPNFYQTSTGNQLPNTSQTNPDQDAQQTSTPTQNTNANSEPIKYQDPTGFVYPIEARTNGQDLIKFTAVEYQASGVTQQANAGTTGENGLSPTSGIFNANRKKLAGKTSKGTVYLPVQASITDQNGVEWGGAALNEIERRLANFSLEIMEGDQVVKRTQNALNKAIREVGAAAPQIRVALAGEAVGIQNLLSRFGQVLNPNLELLFTGPTLRPFNFTFKMSARSTKEGEEIRKIINFFKRNMAPKRTQENIFLKSPNTFFIEYNTYNKSGQLITHPSMNLIKECALTNCSVDYTPMGTHMTYDDDMRTLVSYTMTLSFQELEPIYDGDYSEDSNSIEY